MLDGTSSNVNGMSDYVVIATKNGIKQVIADNGNVYFGGTVTQ